MSVQSREAMVGDGEHVVQFYDHEADLVRAVGDYLVAAVSDGAAAVVIATEPHRQSFEAELAHAGIDVGRAVDHGALVCLDAAETLELFMDEGRIDPARFRSVIGGVVRSTRATGRPVRAYGEMVGLLWDAGDVLGAIELEKLWNELGHELSFALWCGYHTRVAGEEHAEALHEVCHLHTAVVGDAGAQFRAGPDAPAAARRFVAGLLARAPYGHRVSVHDAQLVISELATNAVIHAGSPFSVSVRCVGEAIRLAVHDWCSAPPTVRDGEPTARSGRGLRLVEAVARNWGVDHSPDGKTVWAELSLRAAA